MPLGLKLITAPATEPVSLEEAKARLKLTVAAEDTDLEALIAEARALVEAETGRALLTQTWSLYLDRFPAWTHEIRLPKPPLQSVAWVMYYDLSGALVTLDPARYWVATGAAPGRVRPVWNTVWPFTQYGRPEAVEVRFTCGYGTAAAVPREAKAAVKALCLDWHAGAAEGDRPVSPAARRLMDALEFGECR